MSTFAILDARDPADLARWLGAWAQWPGREVQAHPGYVSLFAGAGRPCAALLEQDGATVLYPFIVRDLPPALLGHGATCDLTSPYGYGGPFAWGETPARLAPAFWTALTAWARAAGAVTEFIRLAVGTTELLPYPGELLERQQNVIVATARSADETWTGYAHKVRKNVRRAQSAGVTIVADERGERLADFLRIYATTMERRGALASYRFEQAFFESLARALAGQLMYFHALLGDTVISTELALVSARRMYSFLGGTDEAHFELRPNDLLKHEMIAWARVHGITQFVLGGGYTRDDGIFRYKQAFTPDAPVPFFTGQRIFDVPAYEALAAAHRATLSGAPAAGFFPAYRAPLA